MAIARTQRPYGPKDFENEVRKPKTDFISKDALNPKNNFCYPDLNQAGFFSNFRKITPRATYNSVLFITALIADMDIR
jgi:hypothetical protein